MKKRVLNCQHEILELESDLLETGAEGGGERDVCVREEEGTEEEIDTRRSIRQTRLVCILYIYVCTCSILLCVYSSPI